MSIGSDAGEELKAECGDDALAFFGDAEITPEPKSSVSGVAMAHLPTLRRTAMATTRTLSPESYSRTNALDPRKLQYRRTYT